MNRRDRRNNQPTKKTKKLRTGSGRVCNKLYVPRQGPVEEGGGYALQAQARSAARSLMEPPTDGMVIVVVAYQQQRRRTASTLGSKKSLGLEVPVSCRRGGGVCVCEECRATACSTSGLWAEANTHSSIPVHGKRRIERRLFSSVSPRAPTRTQTLVGAEPTSYRRPTTRKCTRI